MELRSEMGDAMAQPQPLADLCRIVEDGSTSKSDWYLVNCALNRVSGEVGFRAEAKLEVGGVLR